MQGSCMARCGTLRIFRVRPGKICAIVQARHKKPRIDPPRTLPADPVSGVSGACAIAARVRTGKHTLQSFTT
jgi:hypothetical protein